MAAESRGDAGDDARRQQDGFQHVDTSHLAVGLVKAQIGAESRVQVGRPRCQGHLVVDQPPDGVGYTPDGVVG